MIKDNLSKVKKKRNTRIRYPEKEISKTYKKMIQERKEDLAGMTESKKRSYLLLITANKLGCSEQTVRNSVDIIRHLEYTNRIIRKC